MRFPFVSRDRYDELLARTQKLEQENRELLETLIPTLRYSPAAVSTAPEVSSMQPIANKPTLAQITARANKAAAERAKTPGSTSVVEELNEAAWAGRKAAKHGN